MQMIIGLGNPGEQYAQTRHNVGFMALDYILEHGPFEKLSEVRKFEAITWICGIRGTEEKVAFVYPHTFMNNSGTAVQQLASYYDKVQPAGVLVIHDEVDLPLGTIKFTESSSAAGHNGVSSVIEMLGTQDFRRIRVGIEDREDRQQPPTDAFVLQPFSKEELEKIPFDAVLARVLLELRPKV